MSDAFFPVLRGRGWDIKKRPLFSTRIQRSVAGFETRTAYFSTPLYTFELKHDVLQDAEADLETLLGFFNARQGSFDSFLYLDTSDYKATDEIFGAVAAADSLGPYPLTRSYGGFVELVEAPTTIDAVKLNGTTLDAATYSVTGGRVLFLQPPGVGVLSWSGTYAYRVRFVDDELEFNQIMDGLWELKKCSFIGSVEARV